MSRDLTTAHKNAVTAGSIKPVLLVVGEFTSGTLRFWNGIGTLSYGGNDYTGAGKLLTVSEITETQHIEARGIKIELSGIPNSFVSLIQTEEYQDVPVTLTFAPLDAAGAPIADPFTYFSGKADTMPIEIGRKTSTIRLTAESDLIILNRPTPRRRTPEDQKLLYPGDTFFDGVAGLQSRAVLWGQSG